MADTNLIVVLVLNACLLHLILSDSNCRTGYFESHPGYQLHGHMLKRISAVSIWSCVLECRRSWMCFSLNVWTSEDTKVQCELNKSSKKANPEDYIYVSSKSDREYVHLKLTSEEQSFEVLFIPDDAVECVAVWWIKIPNDMDHRTQSPTCFADREALPDGWYRYQSSAFKYFHEKLTNQIARERCLNVTAGGDLVSLESEHEMEFVKHLFLSVLNTSSLTDEDEVWIGLNDKKTEFHFEWYDGKPLQYKNWAKNEPNNLNSNEDCVIAFPDGTWNDETCEKKTEFVCKAPAFRES